MIDRATIVGVGASLALLVFVLELVRQRRLREDYALLWLATGVGLLILSASRPLLDGFAALLGIVTYPPAAIFLAAILFLLFILLHFSTVVTRLSRENKQIAQRMALLQAEVTALQHGRVPTQEHRADDQQDDQPRRIE